MQVHHWYIANISYFNGNPIHPAIIQCYHVSDDSIFDVIQYDGRERLRISQFNSFKIVREIEEMNITYKTKERKVREKTAKV